MNPDFKLASLTAASGEKVVGSVDVTLAGQSLAIPVFLINGREPGPTLAVTGGIHGAEYASIEAALRLGRSLSPGELRGRVVVVPVVNLPAFWARSIYLCPLDGKNLNRVFPGSAEGSASEQLAAWLFQNVIQGADYYVDLHGGDMNEALEPFTIFSGAGTPAVNQKSLELAEVFGLHYLVRSEVMGSTVSAAAAAGVPAILAESGGQGIWRHEHIAAHTLGLERLLRHLGMVEGPPPDPLPTVLMQKMHWLRSEHDGFYYPRVQVGAEVTQDQPLGYVSDVGGNVLQWIPAPAAGSILFLVTSLAINKGDPLLAVGA